MFAEGGISRFEGLWIVNIKLVDSSGEFLNLHIDEETTRLLFELLKAEWIHNNFRRFLHFL